MDSYLTRSLKNWAAQEQPPAEARERLLSRAAAPPPASESPAGRIFGWYFAQPQPARSLPLNSWTFGPFTQTRAWSFHLITTLHVVA